MTYNLAFLWDNFGPMHNDRCAAVQTALSSDGMVLGIELFAGSGTYAWTNDQARGFTKTTLFPGTADRSRIGAIKTARAIVRACRQAKVTHAFLCHYEQPAILIAATILRLMGVKVFAMGDSKFDDYMRQLRREIVKSLFFLPYHGALSASRRSRDYARFLGIAPDKIAPAYDNIAVDRLRALAVSAQRPDFADRPFICVARLVPKKNHAMLIAAYDQYRQGLDRPRRLILCGSGELEPALREDIAHRGLQDLVEFTGFIQAPEIAARLAGALCMILPSIEEQFGIAIIEALALGIPVIVSDNCGARDDHVRSGVNGFVVEPDNAQGLAWFMRTLGDDAALWTSMAREAVASAPDCDVGRFTDSVFLLAGKSGMVTKDTVVGPA